MRILLTISMCLSLVANGQILDNRQCKVFSDDPFFNRAFIANNKIRKITGKVSTKAKNDQMRAANTEYIYEFDNTGLLIRKFETYILPTGNKDTSTVIYLYDERDNLITKRKNDGYGFYSYNYKYDTLNRKTSEIYCREENKGPSIEQFQLGKQFIIAKESYTYEMTQVGLKQKFYNNYNKLYQERFYYENDLGLVISEETRLLISNKRAVTEYAYNYKGQPILKIEHSSVLKPTELKYKYEYDEFGNILKEEFIRNGTFVSRKEAVYYLESMLLKAIIMFDLATEYMHIVRYEYEFWE